ncbi:hypothetical protein HELRODRAFT_193264 [Helobdella robusta]|uniref:Uncharacterized protein n=1 Tax=Helobdella robusta TaxID=6412 RepID=T1FUT3_HELRO|nr:hypothetical protein HELRODRAFT_193264 [Helobdella robusta]ESN97328.1 hypothetical protein HELRODRAFT_193264 [Helobdella robusta]
MPPQLMNTIDGTQGLMMLAQGPDGVIGLVPAATQHPGLVYNSAGGLVTPTELASAYRGLIPGHANMASVGMPSEVGLPGSAGLSGLKYISQPVGSQQYIMLGGASPSPATGTLGGAGGYIVQGGSAGGAGGLLVHGGAGAGVNGVGGLVMAGAAPGQTGGVLVAAPGGGSYFVHCNSSLPAVANGGSGGYILTGGAGTGGGILVQGGAGGQQYLMQYPGGGASLVQAANQAYDFGGGVGLQQAIHSNKISAFSKNSGQLSDGEKSSNIIAAPSYSVINPYTGAAIGIVGGASSASVQDSQQLDEPPLRLTSSNQQDSSTPSTSTAQATPKVGYYIVPSAGMVGGAGGVGLSGYTGTQYGSPIFAATDPNQATIIAAPSLTPYGRVASNHASIAQGYHPYRR